VQTRRMAVLEIVASFLLTKGIPGNALLQCKLNIKILIGIACALERIHREVLKKKKSVEE